MKSLLIITLFFSLAGKGQSWKGDTLPEGGTRTHLVIFGDSVGDFGPSSPSNSFNPKLYTPKYDTVKVLLWVSDSSSSPFKTEYSGYIWQIRGYEVLEQRDHDAEPYVYYGPRFYWAHKSYLDENKKPLTIFVGMAFKIK